MTTAAPDVDELADRIAADLLAGALGDGDHYVRFAGQYPTTYNGAVIVGSPEQLRDHLLPLVQRMTCSCVQHPILPLEPDMQDRVHVFDWVLAELRPRR